MVSDTSMENNSFVLTDVIIFTGDTFIEDGFVAVKDGQIVEVGEQPLPKSSWSGASIISKPGHTVIPGLIDSHVHGLEGNVQCLEQSLRFGVTTVCDMHNDPMSIKKLQKLANDPNARDRYADFKCAGAGATVEGGWPAPVIEMEFRDEPGKASTINKHLPCLTNPTAAEEFVNAQISQNGASYIKLMHELGDCLDDMSLPRPPLEIEKAVVDHAHKHGVIAVGHAFSHDGAVDLLNSGADGLTHIFVDKPPKDSPWLDLLKRNRAHITPTLSVCASQMGEGDAIQIPFTEDPLAQRMLFNKQPSQNLSLGAKNQKGTFANALENIRTAYHNGVPVVVGSDAAGKGLGTAYGLGVHIEMHLLAHQVGMTPLEVLKATTSMTADRFGFTDRGRVESSKKADLVLVEGDVRQVMQDRNVKCLPIKNVWRDGVPATALKSGY